MQEEGKVGKTPCPLLIMYLAGNVPVSDYGTAD